MSRRGSAVFGWVLAVAGIALFARLGFWQLERMHAKQAMLDAVDMVLAQRHARPLAVAADPQRSSGYDWSAGAGRFAALQPILRACGERIVCPFNTQQLGQALASFAPA